MAQALSSGLDDERTYHRSICQPIWYLVHQHLALKSTGICYQATPAFSRASYVRPIPDTGDNCCRGGRESPDLLGGRFGCGS